ncbi:serine/threonine protein kinase [Actinobacteria bacterium OK074]|nr:serine/threonine protein kinase [Actinobacteria bacterium OK074]
MGIVWQAWDEMLQRPVAVKCARLDDAVAAGRLKKEAQYAGRLHHPNIVPVFDFVEGESACWIVMEYVPSRSLAQLVAEGGPLTPEAAGSVGCQIAAALVKSHTEGVVHGDVTPENILVTDDGVARLMDFGIARALWSDVTQTADGAVVRGKPRYLAPEVVKGQQANEKSDVFSLGATVYAAVEGRSPYGDAEGPVAYLARAIAGHIEPARRAGPLAEPLGRLLELDPRHRPDAAQARKLLTSATPPPPDVREKLRDQDVTLRLTPLSSLTVRLPRSVRRRRRPLALTAVVLAAAVTAGLLVARPWDTGTDAGTPGTIGDARTADPCGLMSTASLELFGDVELDPNYDTFDRCDVVLNNSGGKANVDVMVNFSRDTAQLGESKRVERDGGLLIGYYSLEGDHCRRTIATADKKSIEIMAKKLYPDTPDVCAMADAATDHAVAVLKRGAVPRRTSTFDANSLAHVDACKLLDTTAVTKAVGVDADNVYPGFGNWTCDWESDDGLTGMQVQFSRDNDLGDDDDDKPVTIAGIPSYVEKHGADKYPSCDVLTPHRTFKNSAGDETIELFDLNVYGKQPVNTLCTKGETLAATVVKNITKQLPKD